MTTPVRWVVAALAIALVICLLIWGRGDNQHRGDEVGALGPLRNVASA